MKILITGSNGMLGHDLIRILDKNNDLIPMDSKSLDITNKELVIKTIKEHDPDIVINAAAYTDVDGCESNEDHAYNVNENGVRNLSLACKEVDCALLHFSTDYVFKGNKNRPLNEDDELGPVSVYGKSKLQGELAIKKILHKYFICRTSWLYGLSGKNFVKTMIELSKSNNEVSVVYDQIGSPTFTKDLAIAISELIKTDYYGTYHLTNTGSCSWYDFTKDIFKIAGINVKVKGVKTEEFPRPAPRPNFSVLNNKKWINKGFKPLRNYKDAVKEYISFIT